MDPNNSSAPDTPLLPRQQALIAAVQAAGRNGVFVAGPANVAMAQDLVRRGLIRLEPVPGAQPQPAYNALPAAGRDAAGYTYERVMAVAREWAMLRWKFNDAMLIEEGVRRAFEERDAISPREIVDRLARRFGLEDPHAGGSTRDEAVRREVATRGEAMEREWQQARAQVGAAAGPNRLSAAERARAQLRRG